MQILNVPGSLRYDSSKPSIPGKILSINESASTCNMSFNMKDGSVKVYNGIPLTAVVVDEAFLDTVKQAAQKAGRAISKAINWVVSKVRGWLVIKSDEGEVIPAWNAPVNLAAQQTQGNTNTSSLLFIPSEHLISQAAQQGVKIDEAEYDNPQDRASVNQWWKRVMKEYGTTDKSLEESVKYVNENYYTDSAEFKALNESAIASLDAPADMGVQNVNTPKLMNIIYRSISQQCSNAPGKATVHPAVPMIWGAPGIGKTAIVKQTSSFIKKMTGHSFSLQVVNCPTIQPEDFTLPVMMDTELGTKAVADVPKKWLPVYSPDVPDVEKVDAFYNGSLSLDGEHDGGILFMDEYSRMNYRSSNIFLQLTESRMYNSYVMASRWAMIAAANRKIDMDQTKRRDYSWDNATGTRFMSVNFVPTREEWLEWATSPVHEGSSESNVEPIVTDFIKNMESDALWYKCVAFGSYSPQEIEPEKVSMKMSEEDITAVLDDPHLASETTGYNPRAWDNASKYYRNQKKELFVDPSRFEDKNSREYKEEDAIASDPEKKAQAQKARWEFFYSSYRDLDPGKKYAGKDVWKSSSKVIEFLNKWFEKEVIPMYTGKGSLPAQKIKEYNEYLNVFNDDECAHIWETGEMTVPEDMIKYKSSKSLQADPNLKWKTNYIIEERVLQKLFSSYPGGDGQFKSDFLECVDKTVDLWSTPLKDTMVSQDKWDQVIDKFFTVSYNEENGEEKTVSFCYDQDGDEVKPQYNVCKEVADDSDLEDESYKNVKLINNGFKLLAENDEFLTRVINVIKFFTRVALTTGKNRIIGAFTTYICGNANLKADANSGKGQYDIDGFKSSVLGRIVYSDNINQKNKKIANMVAAFLNFAIEGVKKALNEK